MGPNKTQKLCTAKETLKKQKDNPQNGRKSLQWCNWQGPNLQNIHTTQQQQKKTNPIKKLAEDFNRHFSKEDIQIANRHMKKCSTSLIIREMQIKTMEYHLTLVRTAIINKSTNNKCWRQCEEKGTLLHCWWKCKLVQPLWKTVWSFHRKLNIELSNDPAIPHLGIYPDKSIIQKRYMHSYVHCSTIHNSQETETT